MIVKKKPPLLRRMLWWVIILGFLGTLTVTAVVSIFLLTIPIPDPRTLREREIVESTKIFDRTGKTLLFEIYNEEKRTVIPFEEIPRSVKNATIAIEDSNFYNHPGISVFSIIRAFVNDLMRGHLLVQGGSTITQQLIKNTLLTREKTITRKLKEVILALKIERIYTKDEILNMYLNEIPYGSNAYGIEAAAQTFFGKSARDLTHAEAAYLTALPKAPSYFSPYGTQVDELEIRKNIVLKRMEELQFISPEEAVSAREESVVFLQMATQGIRAPHFVMYVMDTLREQFGEEFIQKQGLVIQTTLDVPIQERAEEVVTKYADTIEKNYNAGNTGLVAINPRVGEILAMVGSRNYFDRDREGNFNVTVARRQPGSAFKPLVYAAAFEKGYTPETIVFDVETEFAATGADSYHPQNYDNIFRGPITFREALAQSVNIAAVKVLYLTGLQEALTMARRLGITTLAGPNQYGLTLVLGGGEVQLLELVSAYGVFANDGVQNEPIAILRIEKNNGEVLWEHSPRPQQVLDQNIARMISSILSDNTARAPAFGSESALKITGREVAAKTGTTNNYRDAWIIGYTPSLVAGVWAGNNDNTPMEKRVAGFIVAPIWHDFMEQIVQNIPPEQFPPFTPPDTKKPVLTGEWRGSRTYAIDSISKKLASDLTPPELVKNQIIPEIHSILYWVDKNDPRGPIPEHPEHDSQFINWETGVRAWAEEKGLLSKEVVVIPTEYDDVHTEKNKPRVSIQTPRPDELFGRDKLVSVTLSIQNTYQISQIDYFLNNEYVGTDTGSNRSSVINLNSLAPASKTADITVRVYDEAGNVGEAHVSITLSSA